MVHFKRDAIRKSIETVTTHFRQLIARKSKNESKTTWSIVCPITLTQRLLTKTAATNFRRLIARGAKINALRLCTMCTGKFAGRPINRKYIFIYILSTPRNIWRYSTIYNANISWRCNAQCAPSAVHRLSCTESSSHSALMESVKRNGFCRIFLQLHKRPTMLVKNIGISFLSGNVEELFFGKWTISQKVGIRFVSQHEIVVLPYCQKQSWKY